MTYSLLHTNRHSVDWVTFSQFVGKIEIVAVVQLLLLLAMLFPLFASHRFRPSILSFTFSTIADRLLKPNKRNIIAVKYNCDLVMIELRDGK